MKPPDPDEPYYRDYEPGPFECDDCKQLCEADFTCQCNWCGATVCDDCWPDHRAGHVGA